MTTVGERIKAVRKSDRVNLTLEKFGERLGVGKTAISSIETGARNLTTQMATAICREFGVNEEWLREGVGEMFAPAPVTEMDALAEQYHMTKNERILVEKILELTPEQRAMVIDFIKRAVSAMNQEDEDPDEVPDQKETSAGSDPDIDAEVEAYRRELELEKRAAERSDQSATGSESAG